MDERINEEIAEHSGREDSHLFPLPERNWTWKPRIAATLEKDKASAAGNAFYEVFCGGSNADSSSSSESETSFDNASVQSTESKELRIGMCMTHANTLWVSKHKGLFRNKDNAKLFEADIEYTLKSCPHINVLSWMKEFLKLKWASREKNAVEAWLKEWSEDLLTWVEMNQEDVSPLMSMNPCYNNALERGNANNKDDLGRLKTNATDMVKLLCTNIVEAESRADVRYHNALKRRSNTGRNNAPRNQVFFKTCYDELQKFDNNIGNFLSVTFNFASIQDDIPHGSFVILSRRGEMDCKNHEKWTASKDQPSPDDFLKFLNGRNQIVSWVDDYKDIIRQRPTLKKLLLDQKCAFDTLDDYLRTFHVIVPIRHDKKNSNKPVNAAIKHWLEMMSVTDLPVVAFDDLLKRNADDGLVACNCRSYFHYGICTHTFCILTQRNIITGYIPTLDPTPLAKRGLQDKKMGSGKSASLKKD
jgi:hypothetical protein